MNPRKPARSDRSRGDDGSSGFDIDEANPRGDDQPLGFRDRLIEIGRAGNRAATLIEAREAIATACAGVAGTDHALLCLNGPSSMAQHMPHELIGCAGMSQDVAQAICGAVNQRLAEMTPSGTAVCSFELNFGNGVHQALCAPVPSAQEDRAHLCWSAPEMLRLTQPISPMHELQPIKRGWLCSALPSKKRFGIEQPSDNSCRA